MRIAYTNLIEPLLASSITSYTDVIGFEVTKIQNDQLTSYWRTSTATAQTVVFDIGSGVSLNTVGVLGHNIATATTVTIQANATNSWGSPSVSQVITWNSKIMLYFFASLQTYRYWRFLFGSQGTLQIGKLWLSSYLTIDPSALLDFKVTKKDGSLTTKGKGKQKFSVIGSTWRKFSLTFPRTPNALIDSLEDMYDVTGQYNPVIFCNFNDIRTYQIVEPCFCSFTTDLTFKHEEYMQFSYSIDLEEDL